MADKVKNVLMLARHKKVEALRMASGLTLLDDVVRVAVIGGIDRSDPEVELQVDSLDFAEVPIVEIDAAKAKELAQMIAESDVVYVV